MTEKTMMNQIEGLKTYFVVKDKNDFSIAKVLVASCETTDFSACGKAVFQTRNTLRTKYPAGKYTIETITTPKFELPITLDNSLIEYKVIA